MTLWADPSVTGASGTMSHGQTVTITGSGFGSKSSAAPHVWDTLEDGSCDTTATVGTWGDADGYPNGSLAISSSNARHANSTYCASGTFDVIGETIAFAANTSSSTWYVQYWIYLDSEFSWGNNNVKLFRLWDTSNDENLRIQSYNNVDIVVENCDTGHGEFYWGACPPSPSGGWWPVVPGGTCADAVFGHTCNCGEIIAGSLDWSYFQTDFSKGTWHLMQFEFRDGDASAANGYLKWWVDGRLVFHHEDITTRTTSRAKYANQIGFFRDSTSDGSGSIFIDDAYADTTWSRVEIGNASTYATCTHREIQPPTSWADGSIAITFNQGSFSAEDTAYVYVVDSTGAVNSSGYEITIGRSESPSTPTLHGVSLHNVNMH